MPGFRHILFPVDFSERSLAVCPYVKFLAGHFQARVSVLHVLQPAPAGIDPSYPVMFDMQAQEEQIRQALKSRLQNCFEMPQAERVLVEGDPATCISEYARNHDVDLIMLSTHGYGKFRSLLLGSVTAKVLHDSECAVWTAPHAEEPSMKQHWPCRNVVVAVEGGSTEQAPLVARAVDLAHEFGAKAQLVHAIPGAEHQAWEFGGDEFAHFLMQRGKQDLAKLQAAAKTDVEASVMAGGIGPAVKQAAEEQHADLVIIGRGVMHEPFGRLRSHAYEIIRQSPCPVLSL